MMLLTRSRSTALPLLLERQQVLALAGLAVGDLLERAAAARCRGARGWVGSHSTNFSPSSDCGRIRQEASSRKSWNAGSSIRITTTALPGLAGCRPRGADLVGAGDVDLGDLADLGARRPGPPRRGPGSRRCRRSRGPRRCRRRRRRRCRDEQRRGGGERERAMAAIRLMGPGGTSSGSQSPVEVAVVEERVVGGRGPAGVRLRRAARAARERARAPSARKASNCSLGRDRLELARSPRCSRTGSPPAGMHARVVAVGVVVGGDLAELARASRAGRACRGGRTRRSCWESSSAAIVGGDGVARRAAGRRGRSRERVGEVVVAARAVDSARRRSRNTGTALVGDRPQVAQERRQVRGRRASRSATSGSRSSSAARRLTKVVFAWRSAGGSATSDAVEAPRSRRRSRRAPGLRSRSAREVVAALGDRAERRSSPSTRKRLERPAGRGSARRAAARSPAAPGRSTCRSRAPPRCCRRRSSPGPG